MRQRGRHRDLAKWAGRIGWLALALTLVQCAKPAPPAPPPAPKAAQSLPPAIPALLEPAHVHDRRLFGAAGLQPFFAALAALEAGRTRRPVRILQLGDSHTANDAFSSRMRDWLQSRFGGAGRGWLPPGIPFPYYRPRLVQVTAAGWRQLGPPPGTPMEAGPQVPLGLDAAVAESERPGALMTLASTEAHGFDRLGLEFVARPDGPPIEVRVDRRKPIRISTAAAAIRAKRVAIPLGPGAREVALTAPDRRPVELLGWGIERHEAGILYENHGTIGATVDLFGRMDPRTVAMELADSRPALIVVAFGTNEGFDDRLALGAYAVRFRAHVMALHRMAPAAAILVLGPPDGNRLDPACPRLPTPRAERAGTPIEARPDICVAGEEDATAPSCSWREPPNLAAVRHIQERVAAAEGWAFWNWSQAMGGACSMHRLFLRDPPLAFADHVHLNGAGYRASADVLLFDLFNAYEAWKRGS